MATTDPRVRKNRARGPMWPWWPRWPWWADGHTGPAESRRPNSTDLVNGQIGDFDPVAAPLGQLDGLRPAPGSEL
jgi:hypothetical protein